MCGLHCSHPHLLSRLCDHVGPGMGFGSIRSCKFPGYGNLAIVAPAYHRNFVEHCCLGSYPGGPYFVEYTSRRFQLCDGCNFYALELATSNQARGPADGMVPLAAESRMAEY